MKRTSFLVSVTASLTLLTPLSLLADNHEEAPPALTDVWMVMPKQGMQAEFAEAAAAHMAYRAEKGDSREYDGFRVAVGDKIGLVQFRACCFDWADQDAYIASDVSQDIAAHWNENVDPYVDHYHHTLDQTDWENSHWPEGQGNGPYYGVTTWKVKEGRGPESSEARKKMSKLAKEGSWVEGDNNNWLWIWPITGAPKLALVSSYANYADMAPPEQSFYDYVVGEIGEEDAGALFGAFGSGFTGSDYTIWVRDPSISAPADEE